MCTRIYNFINNINKNTIEKKKLFIISKYVLIVNIEYTIFN